MTLWGEQICTLKRKFKGGTYNADMIMFWQGIKPLDDFIRIYAIWLTRTQL